MTDRDPIRLTPQQALPKLQQFCAYQERCHREVREKLAGYGVYGEDADALISRLIEEDYLNEERFACQYAGGRFRTKQWGRKKIQFALKGKGLSDYCIRKALREIDDEAYQATLERLAEQKWQSLKGNTNLWMKKRKLQDYLLQKGFENDLIAGILKKF